MVLTMEAVAFRSDLEMVTPKKSQHPEQTTPRRSERKRALFPTSSPQTSDLGHMSPLGSSPDRYSSAPPTPDSATFSPARRAKAASPFGRKSAFCPRVPHRISPRRRFSELATHKLEVALTQKITLSLNASPSGTTCSGVARLSPRSLDRSQEIVPVDQLEQTLLSVMDESDCGDSPRSHVSQRTPGATPGSSRRCNVVSEAKSSQPVTPSKRRSMPQINTGSTTSSSSLSPKRQRRLSLDTGSKSFDLPRARTALFSENGRFPGVKRRRDDGIYLTGRSTKRRKTVGEINAGVRTGIRRPPKIKPKKDRAPKQVGKVKSVWDVAPKRTVKKPKSPVGIKLPEIPKMSLVPKGSVRSPENLAAFSASASMQVRSKRKKKKESDLLSEEEQERVPSPEPDPTKRFFKTNRTLINGKATITVSKNIKINVSNGKLTLNKPGNTPNGKKRRKLYSRAQQIERINMFDDEQEDVADSTRGDVQNILRKLEEDKVESSPKQQPVQSGVTSAELPQNTESSQNAAATLQEDQPHENSVSAEGDQIYPTQAHSPLRHVSVPAAPVGLLSPLSELASSTSTLSLNIGGDTLCLNAAQVKALSAVPDILMEDDEPMAEVLAQPLADTDSEFEAVMFPPSPQACKENESCVANVQDLGSEQKLFPIFNRQAQTQPTGTVVTESGCKRIKPQWRPIGDDQYQIDAGQKRFGPTQCGICGMCYQLGEPEDELHHSEYHDSLKVLKYPGWRNERVVGVFGGNRVIVVKPGDPKPWWSKVMDLLKVVDQDLGFIDVDIRKPELTKVFLYISDKRVVGCLVAESVKVGNRMLMSEAQTGGVDCCSAEEYPVQCGISRIWVHALYRRRHIATELMDCMRSNFIYGSFLSMEDIAFSSPTPSGKQFAERYTRRSDYLVYTGYT